MKFKGTVDYDRMDSQARERLEKKHGKEFWKKDAKPNPQKRGAGIVENIRGASSEKRLNNLIAIADGYMDMSPATKNRVEKYGRIRRAQLFRKGGK